MKTIIAVFAAFLVVAGSLSAQDEKEDLASVTGWLTFGLVSGGFVQYGGTELNAWDNSKWTLGIGWAQTVLEPLPLYLGWEVLSALAMVEQNSRTATVYTQLWDGHAQFTLAHFNESYWDIDLSPRITALLRLGTLTAQAYGGINANWLLVDWQYNDGITSDAKTEVVNGPEVQAVFGVRGSFGFFYADYTRYFNIVNGRIDRSTIAANRIGLGIILIY